MTTSKTHQATSKANDSVTLHMSDSQETFVPHWIIRFTGDFVADVNAKTSAATRDDFINVVVSALNKAYGLDLVASEYDFNAKYSRAEQIARAAKKSAAADTTSDEISAAVLAAYKAGKTDAQIAQAMHKHGMSDDEIIKYLPNLAKKQTKKAISFI